MFQKKPLALSVIALFLLFVITPFAFAAFFNAGEDVVLTTTVMDDLYVGGNSIDVKQNINGDLIAGGGQISVLGNIAQDLMLVGGNVTVAGKVYDDARLAGGNVLVSSLIRDDLLVAGGNIEIGAISLVGGDLVFAAGNLTLDGSINGSMRGGASTIRFNGVVNGDVELTGVEELQFGPKAQIIGSLTYKAPEPLNIAPGVVRGSIHFEKLEMGTAPEITPLIASGVFAGFSLLKFLMFLFAGMLVVWLLYFYMLRAVQAGRAHPRAGFGLGLAFLIVTPFLILFFAMTFVGLMAAWILTLTYLLGICFAKLVGIFAIGERLLKLNEKTGLWKRFGAFAAGAAIYLLLGLIPVVGWLFKFCVISFGFGCMVLHETGLFNKLRKQKLI